MLHKENNVEDLCKKDNLDTRVSHFPSELMEDKDQKSVNCCGKFVNLPQQKKSFRYRISAVVKDRFLASYYKLASRCSVSRLEIMLLRRRQNNIKKKFVEWNFVHKNVSCAPRLGIRLMTAHFQRQIPWDVIKCCEMIHGLYIGNLPGRNMGTSWVGLKERPKEIVLPNTIFQREESFGRRI